MHELNQKQTEPNFHLRNRFQNLATKLLITFQTPDRKFKKTFLIKPCRIKICYPFFIHAEEKKCFCTHQSFEIASSLSSNFHSRSAPFNLQRFVNLVFFVFLPVRKASHVSFSDIYSRQDGSAKNETRLADGEYRACNKVVTEYY